MRTALAALGIVTALAACAPPPGEPTPQILTAQARALTDTFTVADCVAYPGGAVIGQGSTAYCRIVP